MIKIYTNESKASDESVNSPKESVVTNLLNYSKSLEVLKLQNANGKDEKDIEVILN